MNTLKYYTSIIEDLNKVQALIHQYHFANSSQALYDAHMAVTRIDTNIDEIIALHNGSGNDYRGTFDLLDQLNDLTDRYETEDFLRDQIKKMSGKKNKEGRELLKILQKIVKKAQHANSQ